MCPLLCESPLSWLHPFASPPCSPQTELYCIHCKSMLPFCIASGKRARSDDWGECAACRMPYRPGPMRRCVEATGQCPMCSVTMEPAEVRRMADKDAKESVQHSLAALEGSGGDEGIEF